MPNASAHPNIGKPGELERVEEMKVEALCVSRQVMLAAVEALKKSVSPHDTKGVLLSQILNLLLLVCERAHPYEEPAYEVYKLEDV